MRPEASQQPAYNKTHARLKQQLRATRVTKQLVVKSFQHSRVVRHHVLRAFSQWKKVVVVKIARA